MAQAPADSLTPAAPARRILMVAPQPLFRVSGTPINIMMMCRALCERSFEVHVATLPDGEDVVIPGLVLHRLPRLPLVGSVPVGFSVAKLLYNVLLAGNVAWLLLRGRYRLVHAIEEAGFYAVPLARLFRLPAMIDLDSDIALQLSEQGSAFGRMLVGPARALRRMTLRRATAALTVTRHLSEIVWAESPGTRVFEITDVPMEDAVRAPDPARMAAYRAELDLAGRRLLVYTGNCDRRQGLRELLQAMPLVLRRHPDAALVVVGGEPADVTRLQALADQLGVGAAVRLIGRRPPVTMAEYMGMAEVLISPRQEPYATPLKIFSYMASGRPIVATDLPTHTVVLDRESAILVRPSPEGLADGLVRALREPERALELGRRAARLVREKYTYELFQRRLVEAYEAVL
jgi:glycosyltransferase involved in cell wall biosynthesis